MTPTTYGRDFAYCLKSHGGVRGFNASLWRFLLRCTLFCHSVATFLTSVSSYEGGCGFEVDECLALLFVVYIDPAFGVYLLERVDELLSGGFTVSDTWLVQAAGLRFTKEELTQILEQHETQHI